MLPGLQRVVIFLIWARAVYSQVPTTYDSSKLIGYLSHSDRATTWEVLTAGRLWVTSGTYAGDCDGPNRRCALPTNCGGGTLYLDNDSTQKCNPQETCHDMTIFETSPYGLPSAHAWNCRVMGWVANTVYRQLPVTTSTSSSISSSTLSSSTVASTTLLPSRTTPSITVPNTSVAQTVTVTAPPVAQRVNSAWIAGAVIGPLFAVGLISGVIVWKRRRGRHEKINSPPEYGYPAMVAQAFAQPPAELAGLKDPVELDSSGQKWRGVK